MNRQFLFMCLLTSLIPNILMGQPANIHQIKQMHILSDSKAIQLNRMDLTQHEILDTSRLSIEYRHTFIRDTSSGKRDQTNMILEIGTFYTSFYSVVTFHNDSLQTICNKLNLQNPPNDEMYSADPQPTYLIYRNIRTNEITNQERIPFESNYVMEYNEPKIPFSWEIEAAHKQVCGYDCQRATVKYGGRTWIVWFTAEIPVSAGPWKLYGLPGIILQAEDFEKQYIFEAVNIKGQKKTILKYLWLTKQMKKLQWHIFEKKLYQSPMQFINRGGGVFFVDHTTGKWLDENWSWPHNPIERE